jgi:hypothetical protein
MQSKFNKEAFNRPQILAPRRAWQLPINSGPMVSLNRHPIPSGAQNKFRQVGLALHLLEKRHQECFRRATPGSDKSIFSRKGIQPEVTFSLIYNICHDFTLNLNKHRDTY